MYICCPKLIIRGYKRGVKVGWILSTVIKYPTNISVNSTLSHFFYKFSGGVSDIRLVHYRCVSFKRNMKRLIIITFFTIGLLSCKDQDHSDKNTEFKSNQIDNNDQSLLSWETLKNKFPNQNIIQFNFSADGQPMNDLSKAIKLDSLTFNELTSKVKRYADWKEYLEIFYFSKNEIENNEIGIFLIKREFDGTEYTFDLIQFDNKGEIKKIQTLANSWSAAECLGYTRATINLESNHLIQENLQKCYDEEAENSEAIDSIVNIVSLSDLDFKTIKTDTIK